MPSESTSTNTSSSCGCTGCCTAYEYPWVEELLGGSFHPGGAELSARSIRSLQLNPGESVLDIACGQGGSSIAMAKTGLQVTALDASEKQLGVAVQNAEGLDGISFVQANAAEIPSDLGPFQGVLCECAFSLTNHQAATANSWRNLLAPGGRIALSDMVVNGTLPESLQGEIGNLVCIGGALSAEGYTTVLQEAGFTEIQYEDEAPALRQALVELKKKLLLYGISRLAEISQDIGYSLSDLKKCLDDARAAVESGALSYGRFSARRPI